MPNFFSELLEAQFFQVHSSANLTGFEVTKYESLDYVFVQYTRKLTNAWDVFPNKYE